jgi:hypothetical protein
MTCILKMGKQGKLKSQTGDSRATRFTLAADPAAAPNSELQVIEGKFVGCYGTRSAAVGMSRILPEGEGAVRQFAR